MKENLSEAKGAARMTELRKKSIAIGREDLKDIIDLNGYFVDKTLMIKDIIDSTASVTLFTRPRRFGKTLNLS
ncbi:MAG: AAA family ATPase [Firmicutes bacterium]|nr:AAA family ATPase [Bacillota bacterium]